MSIHSKTAALRENLADVLKRHESLRRLYNRLFDQQRYRQFEVTDWVRQGLTLQTHEQLGRIAFQDGRSWVQIANGLEFAYLTEVSGAGLDPEIYQGRYEPENTRLLEASLSADSVFIDIGANIGWFSLHAARLYPGIQVHAFEPGEFARGYLQANIQRNRFDDQISVHRLALSDHSGQARFSANQHGHALNHLQPEGASTGSNPSSKQIQLTTLDAFVAQNGLKRVSFIKCDVEGAELLVLRGARDTLHKLRPALLIEVSPRWSERYDLSVDDLEDLLHTLGYEIRSLDQTGDWRTVEHLATAVGMGADVLCVPIAGT